MNFYIGCVILVELSVKCTFSFINKIDNVNGEHIGNAKHTFLGVSTEKKISI